MYTRTPALGVAVGEPAPQTLPVPDMMTTTTAQPCSCSTCSTSVFDRGATLGDLATLLGVLSALLWLTRK